MTRPDIESIDDLALRISERCRDVINEEIVRYFGQLLMGSGQRIARVAKKVPKKYTPSMPKVGKHRSTTKPRRLIAILREDGAQLSEDLERELELPTRAALYTAVSSAKKILKEQGKTIKLQRGNKGKGDVYAIRTIGGEG